MTSLMERGLAMAAAHSPTAAGGTIRYSRGASSVTLPATFGRSEFQVEDQDGIRVEWSDRDFILQTSALVLDSAVAEPIRGDKVETLDSNGSTIDTFEVLAPAGAKPFKYCDPQEQLIRVHSKKMPS
jgi:hypothetical protein